MIIRPQSKKAKELQKMLAELKKGDDVVTQGGIIGKVSGIKDNELILQLQDGVRVRFLRSAVTGLYTGATAPAGKSETKSEAKAS
jgi:preprotein translocase subunit YajC